MIKAAMIRRLLIFVCCMAAFDVFAQPDAYKWWNPAGGSFPVLEGQAWPKEVKSPYDRFPGRAQSTLDPNVWNISHSSAGLYLTFKTDASNIIVRYVVQGKGNFAMSHMPATGVSGIDLYAKDHNGNWTWAPGSFFFGDTIEYRFSNLEADHEFAGKGCEYRLFLPLYNAVVWMQIGVPENNDFAPMPLQPKKPIVVYGTSIAQGACASRPGLAWTAILGRRLDRPIVNLGFSGSGKLEKPVIDLMTEVDAKLYILDCLPNLTEGAGFTGEEVGNRIRAAVRGLQEKHPSTPILLVEHSSGNTIRIIDTARYAEFAKVNRVLRNAVARLKMEGVRNIYLLSNKEIDFDIDATVDGLHPNDIGMKKYADAYETIIHSILHEPVTPPKENPLNDKDPEKYTAPKDTSVVRNLMLSGKRVSWPVPIFPSLTGYGKVDILWLDGGWVRENYTTPEQEVPETPLVFEYLPYCGQVP